ncbi:MAG: DUF3352 domain-containing protein [Bacteroidetes bacterium]|nr:DUF3352 domain-containing protein [Bacteroidota bacterium]
MSQKIGIVLIVILLAVAGVFAYFFYFTKEDVKVQLTLNAIPENAGIILRASDPFAKWEEIKNKGEYWKDFSSLPGVAALDSQITYFAKAFKMNSKLHKMLEGGEPAFLSMHMTGVHECSVLFSFQCKDASVVQDFQKVINGGDTAVRLLSKTYEGVEIYESRNSKTGKGHSIAYADGILVISPSTILIEDAVRYLKHGSPLVANTSFLKVFKAADPNASANLFVNYRKLPDIISSLVNTEFSKDLQDLASFGSWSEIDINLKADGLLLNGFTFEPDSVNTYLKLFSGQKAQKITVTSILPENTAFFLYYGIEDFSAFKKGYKNYLAGTKSLFEFEKSHAALADKNEIDIEEDIYPWVGNEACLLMAQSQSEEFKQSAYFVIHVSDVELADSKLKEMQAKTNPAADLIEFQGYKIENLGLSDLLPKAFGNMAGVIENSYYIMLEEYVVFANDPGALKHFINSYIGGKTLAKDVRFLQFMEQFSDNTNFMTYLNFKMAGSLWKPFIAEEYYKNLETHLDTIAKFEAFAYQLSSNGNLFYSSAYLKYNPKVEKKSTSLMEIKLDSTFSSRPQSVLNHLTKEKEIILQDDATNLCLISKGGKILWKKKIGEKILGEIHQVDKYKNGKLQYLFNTATKLYLVDRNGNDVPVFPVVFKVKATAPLALLDYDNSRSYRILVPFANGKLINYEISGEPVKGWEFEGMPREIRTTPVYLSFNKKDYIVVVDFAGNVKVIGRKGEEKAKVKGKIPKSKNNEFAILAGPSFERSAIVNTDEDGTLHLLYLDGRTEQIVFKSMSADHKWYLQDVNADGAQDLVFCDEENIYAFKMSKTEIFNVDLGEAEVKGKLYFDVLDKGTFRLGYVDYLKNKLYLVDNTGSTIEGFPIEGSSAYLIEDLDNDGSLELIVGDSKGSLYFYPLSK